MLKVKFLSNSKNQARLRTNYKKSGEDNCRIEEEDIKVKDY